MANSFREFGDRPLPGNRVWQDTNEFRMGVEAEEAMERSSRGQDLPSIMQRNAADMGQGALTEEWRLTFGPDEPLLAELPVGSTAAAIQEVVADTISERLNDHDPDPGVHPSQISVSVDGRTLRPTDAADSEENTADIVIRPDTWMQLADRIPFDLRDWIYRSSERVDGDRLRRDCGEFSQLVEAMHDLCTMEQQGQQHRGSGSSGPSAVAEILGFVQLFERLYPNANIGDLWSAFQEEFL